MNTALTHAPASSAEAAEVVREAHDRRVPLRITGAGTWLDAGRPVRDAEPLHVRRCSGIVEYEPGDLTLTARAGTPLAEIEAVTRRNGQFLALDPFGAREGTLGATVATGSYGPFGHGFGGPRDATLGIEFVTGDGRIVRGGGRVVKNVAGFDLVRMIVGSWGTLGVVTEVSVRLRALPETDETVALPLPADSGTLAATIAAIRAAPVAPWAAELICANLARDLGLQPRAVVLLRLAGNSESVAAQRKVVSALGYAAPAPSGVWSALRDFERITPAFPAPGSADGGMHVVARFSARPSALDSTWTHTLAVASIGEGRAHATLSRGVSRASLRTSVQAVRGAMRLPFEGRTIFEKLPDELWRELSPSAADDALARGLRAKFDPHHVLNPGMFGAR